MLILQTTLHRIERTLYKSGINVALYNAERSQPFIVMENTMYKAMNVQVKTIATQKTVEELTLFTRGSFLSKELVIRISVLLSGKVLSDMIDFPPFLVWAGSQGGQAGLDKLGIEGTFNLKNHQLLAYFDDYSNLIINSVDTYTKEWIARKIQYGIDKRLTPYEIAQSLISEGKQINRIRARRIVLTETAKAMSVVEMELSKRLGFKEIQWNTSRDELVCPICEPLDGEKVAIGDFFIEDVQAPPAHVNCRCFKTDVVSDVWEVPDTIWYGN